MVNIIWQINSTRRFFVVYMTYIQHLLHWMFMINVLKLNEEVFLFFFGFLRFLYPLAHRKMASARMSRCAFVCKKKMLRFYLLIKVVITLLINIIITLLIHIVIIFIIIFLYDLWEQKLFPTIWNNYFAWNFRGLLDIYISLLEPFTTDGKKLRSDV